jgi:hypothetical protein
MLDTILESQFYRPLLKYQRTLGWRTALLGPESIDIKMDLMIKEAIRSNQKLVSIDFSNYDASVKGRLQKASFEYIKSLFRIEYHDEIDVLAERFNTVPIVTPDGIIEGPHGVPSGSTFTNEVDSIAQYLVGSSVISSDIQRDIQGDDGAYVVQDPDVLRETFVLNGLNVNEEKSTVSDKYLVYLQNLYSPEYQRNGIIRGVYPTYRALNRIIHLERFDQFGEDGIEGSDYFSIRTISILENCKNHPMHRELVSYVHRLDKYGLTYSEENLSNYIKRISKGSVSDDFNQFRFGDDLRGMKSFETVKILAELNAGGP